MPLMIIYNLHKKDDQKKIAREIKGHFGWLLNKQFESQKIPKLKEIELFLLVNPLASEDTALTAEIKIFPNDLISGVSTSAFSHVLTERFVEDTTHYLSSRLRDALICPRGRTTPVRLIIEVFEPRLIGYGYIGK